MASRPLDRRVSPLCRLRRWAWGGLLAAACLAGAACTREKPAPAPSNTTATSETPSGATLKPLSQEQQDALLRSRVESNPSGTMGQFSNMFLVMSRIELPYGVGLIPASREIAETELQPIYPPFYRPTLRELLDTLALQTSSQWKYDPSSKHFHSDAEQGEVAGLGIFEFTPTQRAKPYQVTLPKGWKADDRGHWVMYTSPKFPLAVDIHDLGTFSTDDPTQEKEFLERVPREVSLMWANRAKDNVRPEDLQPAKVGPYDALYFETMMPLRDGPTVRWRQWTFLVDHHCFFVVSTILPQLEAQIFPGVEAIIKSFEIQKP